MFIRHKKLLKQIKATILTKFAVLPNIKLILKSYTMSLKVIGTALGRTGTKSLKLAIEQLLGGKCFHMIELLANTKRLTYLKKGHKNGNYDWDALLNGYIATVDYPTCLFYEDLLVKYPEAKFIHTQRDSESWYASVRETIYRGKPKNAKDIMRLVWNMIRSSDMRKVAPVFQFNDQLIWEGQFKGLFEDKATAIEIYEAHFEKIKATIPPSQLLVFKVQDGWQPLCDFLDLPIPNTPFPNTHQRKKFNQRMDKLLVNGVLEF